MKAILAIDFGGRRIGIASGSVITGTSSQVATLTASNGQPDWQQFDTIVSEWAPDLLVVGMPYNMDGSESAMSEKAKVFAGVLAERYDLPVDMVDERLTSAEASSILKEQRRLGLKTKKINKAEIDSLAACLIAESWLQMHANQTK
jgi:putative Holliday junction resolvase